MGIRQSFSRRSKRLVIISLTTTVLLGSAAFKYEDDFFEITKNLEIFTSLYRDINIYYVDETKPGNLMKRGIDAMLQSLDPYTVYIPESRIEDYRFMTTGQYGGIGATIRKWDNKVYISEPYEGFPAHNAGMQAGDEILEVDGYDLSEKSTEEVSQYLKGQAGTSVKIKYRPLGSDKVETVNVNREVIKVQDVPYSGMINDTTGYIKLTAFTETAGQEVRDAYLRLKEEGMNYLVFDLRDNGGGLLREAVNIVNFFVPKGEMVVDTRGKISDWDKTHYALNQPLDLEIPLVVLVNGRSASASEIVSGALQDFDRAVVVGQTTFGKGLVQQTRDISYNSKLKLTVAKYYIPSGRCIQKLDYSHRKNDGSVNEVPDSLLKVFTTAGGREVIDGRGIEPDVTVEEEELGTVIAGLYNRALFFRFANEFVTQHPEIAGPTDFELSDAEFNRFYEMAMQEEISYSNESEAVLKELEKIADREHYLKDTREEFERLHDAFRPKADRDLKKFESQVRIILENEIIARYYFQRGRVEATLADDPFVDSALKYLNPSEYQAVLAPTP